MTFECCFLIVNYNENCNAMSSFTAICHVPWNPFICSATQCFHQFVMVLSYCLLSFFSDAVDSEHNQLVEIPVEHSIFKFNVQKSVPTSLQLKKYCYFQRQKCVVEILRDQTITNDKVPAFRFELKIFTRFLLNLVFRVSGKSVL